MSERVMGTILITVAIAFAAYKLWKLFRKLYSDIKFKSEKTGDAVSAEQYMDELTKQDEQEKPKEEQQADKDQPKQQEQPQEGGSWDQGGADQKGTPKEEGGQKEQPKPENGAGKESSQEGGSTGQPGSDGTPQGAAQGQEDPQQGQEGQDDNPSGQGSGSQEQGGSGGSDAEESEQAIKDALQSAVEDGTLTQQEANSLLHALDGGNPSEEESDRQEEASNKTDTQPQRSDVSGAEEDKKPKTEEELLQQALSTCGMTEDDIKDYTGSVQGREDPKEAALPDTKARLAEKRDKSLFDIMLLKALSLDALDTTMVAIEGEALTLRELIVYVALCKSCHGEAELYMSRKLSYYIQMCDGYGIPRLYDCLAEKLQGLLPKDRRLEMIKEPGSLHDLVNSNDIL